MGSMKDYAAISSKIRAMERERITKTDFWNLLDCKTVEEIVKYLKCETAFSSVLESVDEHAVVIEDVEVAIRDAMLSKFERLSHFFVDENKRLFKMLFERYEIENLKAYLRAFVRGEDVSNLASQLMRSEHFGQVNYDLLSQSRTLADFVEGLKGTKYYEVIRHFMDESDEKILFYMEMNLDRLYFEDVEKQMDKLRGEDRKLTLELLGKNSDILNITWSYRALKYYNLSPEEILNYTLRRGWKLKYKELKHFCYLGSVDQMIMAIKETPYGFLVDGDYFELTMERNMEKYIYTLLKDMNKRSNMTIMQSIIYLHMLEYEMRDIFTLIEAKRYNFSKEETIDFLVVDLKKGVS